MLASSLIKSIGSATLISLARHKTAILSMTLPRGGGGPEGQAASLSGCGSWPWGGLSHLRHWCCSLVFLPEKSQRTCRPAPPFPARGDCLPSRRREYSFYRQPPKNLLRCKIEKASPMAGLWGSTPPFLLRYMKTPPVVSLERHLLNLTHKSAVYFQRFRWYNQLYYWKYYEFDSISTGIER